MVPITRIWRWKMPAQRFTEKDKTGSVDGSALVRRGPSHTAVSMASTEQAVCEERVHLNHFRNRATQPCLSSFPDAKGIGDTRFKDSSDLVEDSAETRHRGFPACHISHRERLELVIDLPDKPDTFKEGGVANGALRC